MKNSFGKFHYDVPWYVVLFAFNVLEAQPPHYGNPVPFPLPILVLSLKGKHRPLVLGERCPPVLGGKMPFDAGKFLSFAITSPPFSLMMNTLFFGLGYRELFPQTFHLSSFPSLFLFTFLGHFLNCVFQAFY